MQTTADELFLKPRFRYGVKYSIGSDRADLSYRDQGAEIDLPNQMLADAAQLFDLLALGGLSQNELAEQCPSLANQLSHLFRELDRLGLLTETARDESPNGRTGYAFWCEIQRFIAVMERTVVTSRLFESMNRNEMSAAQMCGYVLEYYHVVHQSPGIISPALSHIESTRSQTLLREFLLSEMNHDKMIAEALFAVGYDSEQLETMIPLPMTFAITSSLGVYAEQHPLSFKAALYLLEQRQPAFHRAFQEHCLRLGLPKAFIDPILMHSGINEDGAHEDISRLLLTEVAYVSAEEEQIVKKHLCGLLTSMARLEGQILAYYGDSRNPIPRCFN